MSFNAAIVRGYNALTGSKVKLGSCDHDLSMREGVIRLNNEHRGRLSNDLGAVAGLLFDIGTGRCAAPPRTDDEASTQAWQADLRKVREESAAQHKQWAAEREWDTTHTEIQGWLRDLGKALGFQVWVAANDRNRAYGGGGLRGRAFRIDLTGHRADAGSGRGRRLVGWQPRFLVAPEERRDQVVQQMRRPVWKAGCRRFAARAP